MEKKDNMNIVDKLYTEWAWRTKSGVPDINNPEDKVILNDILSELNVPVNEKVDVITEEDDLYDRKIAINYLVTNLKFQIYLMFKIK